jgi:hypothetical protein
MDLTQRPDRTECFDYHRDYVAKVPDGNILETLEQQLQVVPGFIQAIAAEQLEVVHAPYMWSVRTVIEHCCDAERVFGYRAMRFATGDSTDLPGWDENHFATCGYARIVSGQQLAEEFRSLRAGNLQLLKRLNDDCWSRIGTADGRKASVRTIAWLMAGHWLHHASILQKRLGQ